MIRRKITSLMDFLEIKAKNKQFSIIQSVLFKISIPEKNELRTDSYVVPSDTGQFVFLISPFPVEGVGLEFSRPLSDFRVSMVSMEHLHFVFADIRIAYVWIEE